jgi:hypothetical protein
MQRRSPIVALASAQATARAVCTARLRRNADAIFDRDNARADEL